MKINYLKLAILSLILTFGFSVNAQNSDPSTGVGQGDSAGPSIKLIDNKGTIKYMQSNNGITTVTSSADGNKTTTTWQLGGTLIDATTITTTADTGTFTIDGEEFSLENIATTGVEKATTTSAVSAENNSGYTILVRNEKTGNIEKLLATNLISGIRVEMTQETNATADVPITVEGLPTLNTGSTIAKLFVFRNGIKLRSATDFVATAGIVTITYDAADLPMYADDIIEIQYIK